ncbi:MAG: hypothetical protein V9E90_15390 [Saprospiraceae bacterium]|jgi:hypothetical protein
MNNLTNPESDPKLPMEDLLKGSSGFVIPENYMDQVADSIINQIRLDNKFDESQNDLFKLPANYFEEFPNRILNKVESGQIPESLQQNPFKVPENYFDTTIQNILEKTSNAESKLIVKTNFKQVWSYAATACVLLVISWLGFRLYSDSKPVDYFSNITEDELLEYVSTYAVDFDQSSLASVINEEEINSLDIMDDDIDDETSDLLIQILE